MAGMEIGAGICAGMALLVELDAALILCASIEGRVAQPNLGYYNR